MIEKNDKFRTTYSNNERSEQFSVKFGFSQKTQTLPKERRVLCAQQHTCQNVDEDFQKKCGQVVLYVQTLSFPRSRALKQKPK